MGNVDLNKHNKKKFFLKTVKASVKAIKSCRFQQHFPRDTKEKNGLIFNLVCCISKLDLHKREKRNMAFMFHFILCEYAAKAAVINFYEALRFEVGDDVGITVATHGSIGSGMTGGRFMLEKGDRNAMEGREK